MKTASPVFRLLLSIVVSVLSVGGSLAVAMVMRAATSRVPDPSVILPPGAEISGTSFPPSPSGGRERFVQSCAHCHGDDARGSGEDGDGPDLYGLRLSDARIATIIRQGIHGEMPAFGKKYAATDIAMLIAYLRTLH